MPVKEPADRPDLLAFSAFSTTDTGPNRFAGEGMLSLAGALTIFEVVVNIC
jgi:hypothetical protein